MEYIKINSDDYFSHSGIRLETEFFGGQSDDGKAGVDKFLENVSQELWNYLRARYFIDEKTFQKSITIDSNIAKRYKKALCYQVDYLRSAGDVRGNPELLEDSRFIRELSPRAYDILKMLGLTNIQPISDIYRRY